MHASGRNGRRKDQEYNIFEQQEAFSALKASSLSLDGENRDDEEKFLYFHFILS